MNIDPSYHSDISVDQTVNEHLPAFLQEEDSALPSAQEIIPKSSPGLLQKVANFVKENKILIASGAAMAIGAGVILAAAVAGGPTLLIFGALFFSLSSFLFVLAPFLDKEIDTALSQVFNQMPQQPTEPLRELEYNHSSAANRVEGEELSEEIQEEAYEDRQRVEERIEELEEEEDYGVEYHSHEVASEERGSFEYFVEDAEEPNKQQPKIGELPLESSPSDPASSEKLYMEQGREDIERGEQKAESIEQQEPTTAREERSSLVESTSLQEGSGALQTLNRDDHFRPTAVENSRFTSLQDTSQMVLYACMLAAFINSFEEESL